MGKGMDGMPFQLGDERSGRRELDTAEHQCCWNSHAKGWICEPPHMTSMAYGWLPNQARVAGTLDQPSQGLTA